ncbi:helix-turn-helix transcriptional regulator [Streptomyces sp. NPDC057539]|uniref:helix-turn-helix transcriptional regulator n=1 Tax=Streptomyces sp. NPDC057539 TaxID=3346159 RepID=UPI003699F38E
MAREQQSGSGLGFFLRTRRAQVKPEDVGLVRGAGLRRSPGLRREELAALAGISMDYYSRLERGQECNPSPAVVDALARALRLDAHEHEHLRDLAEHVIWTPPKASPVPEQTVGTDFAVLVESLRPNPAYVISRTMDVLASNPGGLRLYAGSADRPAGKLNAARYIFLHPDAPKLFADWEGQARSCVGNIRALAGTEPDAPGLARLIDELLLESPDFADMWKQYDVQPHATGDKSFHHPQVGDLTLGFQSMQLDGTPGHRLVVFYAEPGTPDHDKILLLDTPETERTPQPAKKKRS